MPAPARPSRLALSSRMPSHLPSQICQRAMGFTATICMEQSSMSRASVPHASQSVEKPSSAVTTLSV